MHSPGPIGNSILVKPPLVHFEQLNLIPTIISFPPPASTGLLGLNELHVASHAALAKGAKLQALHYLGRIKDEITLQGYSIAVADALDEIIQVAVQVNLELGNTKDAIVWLKYGGTLNHFCSQLVKYAQISTSEIRGQKRAEDRAITISEVRTAECFLCAADLMSRTQLFDEAVELRKPFIDRFITDSHFAREYCLLTRKSLLTTYLNQAIDENRVKPSGLRERSHYISAAVAEALPEGNEKNNPLCNRERLDLLTPSFRSVARTCLPVATQLAQSLARAIQHHSKCLPEALTDIQRGHICSWYIGTASLFLECGNIPFAAQLYGKMSAYLPADISEAFNLVHLAVNQCISHSGFVDQSILVDSLKELEDGLLKRHPFLAPVFIFFELRAEPSLFEGVAKQTEKFQILIESIKGEVEIPSSFRADLFQTYGAHLLHAKKYSEAHRAFTSVLELTTEPRFKVLALCGLTQCAIHANQKRTASSYITEIKKLLPQIAGMHQLQMKVNLVELKMWIAQQKGQDEKVLSIGRKGLRDLLPSAHTAPFIWTKLACDTAQWALSYRRDIEDPEKRAKLRRFASVTYLNALTVLERTSLVGSAEYVKIAERFLKVTPRDHPRCEKLRRLIDEAN